MVNIKAFCETSTIHGLYYIATTRKEVKILWLMIVIGGFSGAGVMIYQSFQAWDENPVNTVTATLPITEITLPKVTVCPPKNTFTNLNYDLMMLENMTLDNDTRDELTQFAVGLIQDQVYNEVMTNISKFEEENRYYNWYMGLTKIELPFWGVEMDCSDSKCLDKKLRYEVNTYATSGTISTQYFGHEFDEYKIEKYFFYFASINPPHNYKYNSSVTLYIEVEKNIKPEFDQFWSDNEIPEVITLNRIESPPGDNKLYQLRRDISEDAVKDLQMDLMPGFRLTWYYNEKLEADSLMKQLTMYDALRTIQFYRFGT